MSEVNNRRCLRARRTQPKFEVTGNKNPNIIKTIVNKNDKSIENKTIFKLDSCDGDTANKKVSIQEEIPTLEKGGGVAELKVLYIPSSYKFNWTIMGKENVSPKVVEEIIALSHGNKFKIHNADAQNELELCVEKLTGLNLTESKDNPEEQSSNHDNKSNLNNDKLDLIECENKTIVQNISQKDKSNFNQEKLDVRVSDDNTKEPSSRQEDESNFNEEHFNSIVSEDNAIGQSHENKSYLNKLKSVKDNKKGKNSSQGHESNFNEGKLNLRGYEDNTKGTSSIQEEESKFKEEILNIRGYDDKTEHSNVQENGSNLNDGSLHLRRCEDNTKGQRSSQENESNLNKGKLDLRGCENTTGQSSIQENESIMNEGKLNLRSIENTKDQSSGQKNENTFNEQKSGIRGSEENPKGQIIKNKTSKSNLKEDKFGIKESEDNTMGHSSSQEDKDNLNEEKLSVSIFENNEETRNIEAQSDKTSKVHGLAIINEESHSRSLLVQNNAPISEDGQKEHVLSSICKKIEASTSQKTNVTNPPTETVSRQCLQGHRRKPQSEYKVVLPVNNKEASRESTANSENSKSGNLENIISNKIRKNFVSSHDNSRIHEPHVINSEVENSKHGSCENELTQIIERVSSIEHNNKELNLKPNYVLFKEVEQEVPIRDNKESSDTVSGTNSVVARNVCDRNTEGINKEYQNKYENKTALQVVPSIEKGIKQCGSQSTPKAIPPSLPIPPAQIESSKPRRFLRARRRENPAIETSITIANNKEINQDVKGNTYNKNIPESGPTPSTSKDNAYTSLPNNNADRDSNNHNKNSKNVTLSCDSILTCSSTVNLNTIVNPDARESEKTKNKSLIKGNKETERSKSQTTKNNEEMSTTTVRNEENETVCSICLEPCSEKAFTNPCLHEFCFTCILQWSEVKPECPLCKCLFSSILHNIKGDDKYDEQLIPQGSTTAKYETNTRVADAPSVVPQPFENDLQRFVTSDRLAFHYCPICYRACSSADVLALHLQSDHNRHIASSEPRAVSTSRTPYAQLHAYESTSRTPYAQQEAYECNICRKVCASGAGLTSHLRTHARNDSPSTSSGSYNGRQDAYNCKICGKVCASGAGLASHLRAHARNDSPSTSSESYNGRHNTYEYESGISYEPVWASVPSTSRPLSQASSYGQSSGYACNVCGRSCASGAGLASHMRAHSRRGEY